MYIRRSYHHPGQAAVSSYLGAPGSSPAERMREDAELELGAPSEGKDAVFESGVFGEIRAREKMLCLSARFSGEDNGSEHSVPKRRCRAGARRSQRGKSCCDSKSTKSYLKVKAGQIN